MVRPSKAYQSPELSSKRNSNCCAGTEEISESALGDLELLQAGDGRGLRAISSLANEADVRNAILIRLHLRRGHRQLRYVHSVICARIAAIENVEELAKRLNLPAFANLEGARD